MIEKQERKAHAFDAIAASHHLTLVWGHPIEAMTVIRKTMTPERPWQVRKFADMGDGLESETKYFETLIEAVESCYMKEDPKWIELRGRRDGGT